MYGIQGITRDQAQIGGAKKKEDPMVKQLKKQIMECKQQIQELNGNKELPDEVKKTKLKALQDKMKQLNTQLTQQQAISQGQVDSAKKQESPVEAALKELNQNSMKSKNKDTFELSMPKGMESLISAGTSMKQMQTMSAVKTSMQGQARTLKSEIAMDQSYGSDTSAKEGRLSEMEARITKLDGDIAGKNGEIGDKHSEEVKKDTKAEEEKEKEEKEKTERKEGYQAE